MLLALTPLQDQQKSRRPNDYGFSLLEVIVALAIMAMGFVTVSQLFSGSVRSIRLSEQYLKGTTLAHSKLGEFEVKNYRISELEGTFPDEKEYRWKLELSPYTTSLNNRKNNIQLSEVTLNVLWEDAGKKREVELNTLKLDGALYPGSDSFLAKSFSGGLGSIKASEKEETSTESPATESPVNISGHKSLFNSYISGASTPHISGN